MDVFAAGYPSGAASERGNQMSRGNLIKLVDILAFVLFVLLTSTGILLHYAIPPRSGRWTTIWSMTRHEWGEIHFWIAVAFLAVLSVHLALHRQFVLKILRGTPGKDPVLRPWLGIVGLIALLAIAASPFI
jgi:hypothetical protein